jgi:hypothetical protein
MSNINQIYTIVNEIAQETLGKRDTTSVKAWGDVVSFGDAVLSSDENKDKFVKSLVDRIAKTVISVRRYTGVTGGLIKDSFEYGCILQKIYVDLPDARVNNSWEIGEDNYKAEFAPVIKPTVKQKLFDKITTFEVGVTIPDSMLKTAFTSASAMSSFIDAIFVMVENKMQLSLENNANLTRASFIARRFKYEKDLNTQGTKDNKRTLIDLLYWYNTAMGTMLTSDNCLYNTDFLMYATRIIDMYKSHMAKMSTYFNDDSYIRHTDSEHLNLTVLQDFASACDTYLKSNVYHNNLVGLPNYNTVQYWQSPNSFKFENVSKVSISFDGTEYTLPNVVGVMYDIDAMGITINNQRSVTERNNHDEYTNYYSKCDIGYFNDMSENGIVFHINGKALADI